MIFITIDNCSLLIVNYKLNKMNNTNFQEDYSAQIPALRTLINAGYTFLSRKETMEQRFGRTGNVLLEPILKKQLAAFNEIRVSSTQTEKFTQSNIDEAV